MVHFGLDWSPNTTHVALFVALQSGAFARRGLDVRFVSPDDDGAPHTPADGLVDGTMQFGLCPCDQLVTRGMQENLLAVAALIRRDISAVVCSTASGISRPRDLAGKSYSSCGYPLEVATINALIAADGGQGCVVENCCEMRMDTDTALLAGVSDCAWQYLTWEVLRSSRAGKTLAIFPLADYGVKFGYMNCITTTRQLCQDNPDVVRGVLDAVREGAEMAVRDPQAAAQMLYLGSGRHPELADEAFVAASIWMLRDMEALGKFVAAPADADNSGGILHCFGKFDPKVWADFGAWILHVDAIIDEEGRAVAELACANESRAVWSNDFITRKRALRN